PAYRSCLQFITIGALANQRVSQLASWNAGAFLSLQQPLYPWVNATFYTVAGAFFGSPATLRTYVNGVLQVPSIVGNNNVTTAGSVGLFVYDGDPVNYDFDNFLARRYTEPEPVTAFATVSAFDENGDSSIVLPGTQYAYKAYTHDATAIAGAASTAAPHYSFGNTSTQTNTTAAGGGANKNWSYKTGATTLAAPALD